MKKVGQKQKDDIEFGRRNEEKNLPILKTMFGEDLVKTKNTFNIRDFYNKNYFIEQKSRKCKHDQYPDYMIGWNKIEDAVNADRKYIIVMDFTDGTFFYQFNKEDIGNGIEKRMGGRMDREDASGNLMDERKECAFIHKRLFTRLK
jgi:hypothetical protein